ncbi:POTE ankyrin domain family member B2-like protein [Columba livia]|nr:POTE ankyrin domain family member B2-like protein [Columba livia]
MYFISRTPLHLACANGHADVVRFLAGKKCNLNPRGMYKKTPLMLAVQHQHKDCVTALLEHGADADRKCASGNTALHMAALMPSKAMVELLLEHNAQIDARNDLGYTPLAVAIIERREEMVEFLLEKGADVNARDIHQRTPLKIAGYARNTNVVRLLLQHGAVLSHRDENGFTDMAYLDVFTPGFSKTLQEYVRSKRTGECSVGGAGGAAVHEISSSATTAAPPVGAPARSGAGVLPEAGAEQEEDFDSLSDFEVPSLKTDSEGPMELLDAVLLPGAKQQGACAHPVAEERHNGVLPAAGAAQEEEDFDFSSLDEEWVRWLQQELASALRKCSLAEASLEAEKRHSRDLQEQKLQLQKELDSSKAQLQELKERLIRNECYAESLESDIKNKERELTASKHLQGLLVTSSGTAAVPELEERVQQTPLHLACANGHADVVRFLAGKKCNLNPRGMYKKTPLMLAVQHQHKDCVTALLEHGADADRKCASGNTALHMAALMPSKAMVELLLEHNAQIDARNDLGYTPLAVAIIERREEMVEFLLEKGADVNARDIHQRTPLKIAGYARNTNVVRLLLQHGAVLSHRDENGFTDMAYLDVFTPGFSKTLHEYVRSKRTGECSVGGAGGAAVHEISSSGTTAAPPVGAPAQSGAGVLPEAGAEQEEDFDSLSDFETDSEGPMELLDAVLLPGAKQQGACAHPVAEERHNGVLPAAGAAQEEEDFDFSSLEEEWVRWLQQELASALRKCSQAEASLEAEKHHSRDLQEQKLQLQKELDSSKAQLQELKERLIRNECYAESLESDIKNKERELTASKHLQGLLVTSSGTAAVPELEERVQQ